MKKLFLNLTLVFFVIPFGISQDLPSYVPTNGLVAYYPFNGNANDASGNGNHGTVNGATLTPNRNDIQNSSYGFDGLDNYISINSNNNQLDFFGNCCITISAWIKLDNNDNQYSILTNSDYNNIHQQYALKVDSNSKLYFLAGDKLFESNGINYSSSNVNNGQWTHTLVSYDGNKLKLYLNGNLDYENQIIDNFPESPSSVAFIGNSWGANNDFFPGQIDDVGIWNRALTEQEIQNLYTSFTGDIILNGLVSAENNQIRNVADPTHAQDAATKNYTYSKAEVDALIANLQQQINEMNQAITSSELEGNWNVKELYYLNPDTNEITSTFPTPECSKPYQYYEFLASKEIFWTGIGTNWVTQSCTSNEFGVKQDPYTITTANSYGDDPITYINFPNGPNTRNWEIISRPSENTIIIRAWQNNEISLYNNQVHGIKLVKESRIESNLN